MMEMFHLLATINQKVTSVLIKKLYKGGKKYVEKII